MGIHQLAGRDFNDHDRQGTTSVAIVNRTFVNRYLSGRDPLATQFTSGYPVIDSRLITIIGVVEDVRQQSLSEAPEPAYYTPNGQGMPRRQTIIVHTSADSAFLRSAIRDEVRKLDPQVPVDFERVSDSVNSTINRQQLGMTLMLVFAAAAIALAAVGIYGVIAYGAAQRRKDVAIRLALGATQRTVFCLVLKQGGVLSFAGAAIGVVLAYFGGRIVSSSLYQVRASDPVILGVATLVVLSIALFATVIPAYRSARMDPGRVLRPE
jgi:ABC-type antimicrobial peptide transport system permease subunit